MCVTYIQPFGEKRWYEFHRTESITNCHDPDFAAKVKMAYRFEEQQHLLFEIYDIDSNSTRLQDHDFLGRAKCTLGQIISSGNAKLPLSYDERTPGDGSLGYLLLTAEELTNLKDDIILEFSGADLDKKDWFGKSDPFLVIHKSTESSSFSVVHKTEVIKCTLNPKWKRFRIPISLLCNGDDDRNLKFVCWDWNASGNHSLIGEFYTTLRELSQGPCDVTKYFLINPKKKEKSSYKNSGQIRLEYFERRPVYSFMDYIKGGTQIHCTIAIDFTGNFRKFVLKQLIFIFEYSYF